MKKSILCNMVLCVFAVGISFAMEFSPMLNMSLLGGQYVFESENPSAGGNLNLSYVPVMKFSDAFSLMPIYYFDYRGVKDVTELVGGGTLTQQAMSHNLAIKPIISFSDNFRLKTKAGYMMQYFQETKDEIWGKGAFDYSKMTFGGELLVGKTNFGYNLYTLRFPNYASLAETQGNNYGVELSSTNPGKNILDFLSNEITVSRKFSPLENFVLDSSLIYTIKNFSDQKLINEAGGYDASNRNDNSMFVNLFPSAAIIPTGAVTFFGGLQLTWVSYSSNQNHYDVGKTQYLPKYYNYSEVAFAPTINLGLNTIPLRLNLTYTISSKQYSDRLAQAEDGAYLSDKTKIDTNNLSFGISYPLLERMSIYSQYNMLNASSNMKDETVYRYNYKTNNFFLGLTYEL